MSKFRVGQTIQGMTDYEDCLRKGDRYTVKKLWDGPGVYLELCSAGNPDHWCLSGWWGDSNFVEVEEKLTREEVSSAIPLPDHKTLEIFLKHRMLL